MKHLVLYTRKYNENASTPLDPKEVWTGQADLSETGTFCVNPDFDMLVPAALYEVREVELPDWLSAEEWIARCIQFKYLWGAGVDVTWSEAWQRGLLALPFTDRYFAVKLLKTQTFRSEFRASLQRQIIAWLETPPAERTYASPLSQRQWEAISHRRWAAKYAEEALYRERGERGRLLTTDEAMAAVANVAKSA